MTDCANCGATSNGCEVKRWLSGHGCCDACAHQQPDANQDPEVS